MKKLYLLLIVFGTSFTAFSQADFFKDINESSISIGTNRRVVFPVKYRTTSLEFAGIRNFLSSLPVEATVFNRRQAPVLRLPMPDGTMASFHVWESSIQEPGLQNQFPDIRTYAGQGIDDPYATIRFDFNPYDGFHGQILSPNGRVYLDPYARGDLENYISYYQRDNHRSPSFICEMPEVNDIQNRVDATPLAGACRGTQLYTYRLAVACTDEYAAAVGGTSASLLHSKIVTSVNRVNGVYETEVSVRLVLVATNNLIEFFGGTDPFTGNNSATTLITESQTQITNRIGSANFDIGHTFSTGAGGLAGLGVVCNTSNKARGVTGSSNPVGDGYDIDYVAHEMGHQFSGNHTFNGATANCSGANRNGTTAYEPGSGTTIQAYAGICGVDDIQPHSDPYFHSVSFDEISTFVEAGGATCRVVSPTGNTLPAITAMNNNGANIPINTPFTLSATATDADGDAITYDWEEWDLGAQGLWNAGAGTTTAPLFKSREPKTTGSRTFPDIAVILAGYPASPTATMGGLKGETLPTVARALKFRLTVRDNRAGGGGVVTGGSGCQAGFTTGFQVNTIAGTGPFIVTLPNGGESYPGSTSQTITWNVAGTSASPISATNVKISLSTDGGLTYPNILTPSTANDGSEALTLPNIPTTTARIKVEAVGNIFFDISNANFTITNAAPGFDFDNPAATSFACGGAATATVSLGTVSYFSYSTPINLSASGVPSGTTISFGTNPVVPGNSSVITLNNANTLSAGTYNITITGVSGSITLTRVITFIVQTGTGPSITTQPASQTLCEGSNAIFNVVPSGTVTSYQWQVSTDGGTVYNNISSTNSATLTLNAVSYTQSSYRYRVVVSGQCNSVTSNAAILTVNPAPSVPVITASATTICLGDITTLSATAISPLSSSLGNGTSTSTAVSSGSALGPNPLQNYYGGNKQQMLFRATELTALGFINGSSITAIKLNLATADPSVILQNLVVKMKNTLTTTMASWETGLATVRTAGNYTVAVGLNNIALTTPFAWDGTSNLVVEINYSNGNAGTTGSVFNTAKYSATTFVSTRFYRIDNQTAAFVDAYVGTTASTTFNYSQRNDITFDFNNAVNITWGPIATLYTNPGATTGYTGTVAPTVYAKPIAVGTANYIATATNAFSCTNTAPVNITVNNCAAVTLNLKVFIQGYYQNIGAVNPMDNFGNGGCLFLTGGSANQSAADNITVSLMSAVNGSLVESQTGILNTNGTISLNFTAAVLNNSYYIRIKHRNSIETWSMNPVTMIANASYDFTTAANKAYGNNQAEVEPGVWAIYSGDITDAETNTPGVLDGIIESADYSQMENDVYLVSSGYIAADITGDGVVESADYSIMENNVYSVISVIRPF